MCFCQMPARQSARWSTYERFLGGLIVTVAFLPEFVAVFPGFTGAVAVAVVLPEAASLAFATPGLTKIAPAIARPETASAANR